MNITNPYKEQDRVLDLYDNFCKSGDVMFRQQRTIYNQIADRLQGKLTSVLEFGCGNGVGTAILERKSSARATDISQRNVEFASKLYPWILFSQWDICKPWLGKKAEVVVAIEVLEHVTNPQAAIKNMLEAAYKEVWISTPNGMDKPRPPSNPYHVCEYTTIEVVEMIADAAPDAVVRILNWENFEFTDDLVSVNPLVYRITKK